MSIFSTFVEPLYILFIVRKVIFLIGLHICQALNCLNFFLFTFLYSVSWWAFCLLHADSATRMYHHLQYWTAFTWQRLVYGAQAEAAHDLGFDSSHIADAIRGTSTFQKSNCTVRRIVHPEVAKVFWKNRTKVQIYWNLYFGLSNWIKWSCAVILMTHPSIILLPNLAFMWTTVVTLQSDIFCAIHFWSCHCRQNLAISKSPRVVKVLTILWMQTYLFEPLFM